MLHPGITMIHLRGSRPFSRSMYTNGSSRYGCVKDDTTGEAGPIIPLKAR